MKKKATNKMFDLLASHFVSTGQLGDYDKEKWQITLYDIENKPEVIQKIILTALDLTMNNCKVTILSPYTKFTNIKILDIGL